jgi:hypothetical protein
MATAQGLRYSTTFRSGVKPLDAVFNGIARRQDEHRHPIAGAADPGEQARAVAVGKAQIEDCRIVTDRGERLLACGGRADRVDGESCVLKHRLEQFDDSSLIFNEQQSHQFPDPPTPVI